MSGPFRYPIYRDDGNTGTCLSSARQWPAGKPRMPSQATGKSQSRAPACDAPQIEHTAGRPVFARGFSRNCEFQSSSISNDAPRGPASGRSDVQGWRTWQAARKLLWAKGRRRQRPLHIFPADSRRSRLRPGVLRWCSFRLSRSSFPASVIGILPPSRAPRLNPTEALRYE